MYSLYNSMKVLRDVYTQLVESSLKEGKPLAYTEDPLIQQVINHVLEKEEEDNKKDDLE